MAIHAIVLEMTKLLKQLDGCLDKAVAFAATKKFDPNTLLQSRLAPDMFPLGRQIQATCDQAKYAASRVAGKETPSHPETETTIEELKQRIASVITYLGTFTSADFENLGARTVTTPRWEGKSMTATNYLVEHAMPNFFFHMSMAYAILRHNGVDVGKRDFLGPLTYR